MNLMITSLLKRTEVEARTGLSRSTIYSKMSPKDRGFDPSFPSPVITGTGSVRWLDTEVEAWIATRPRARSVNA